MSPRLLSLADLATLFGPDAQAQAIKNGARAEAGRREVVSMDTIQQPKLECQPRQFEFVRRPEAQPQNDFDRAVRLLEVLLRRAEASGPYCDEIEITPEMAKLLLQKNSGNRTVKPRVVTEIARDICEGHWQVNGETIILALDGSVNDGQHRLNAVVEAGRPIRTFVSIGVSRETRMTVDSVQTTKTPGDFVSMNGIDSGNLVAAIASYLWQIQNFGFIPNDPHSGGNKPSKPEVIAFAKEWREPIAAALKAVPGKNSSRIASHSLLAVSYLLILSRYQRKPLDGEDEVGAFINALLAGGKGEGDPVFVIRELMLEDKRRKRFTPRRAVELVLRAWNARRTGRTLAKAVGTGQWPLIEK